MLFPSGTRIVTWPWSFYLNYGRFWIVSLKITTASFRKPCQLLKCHRDLRPSVWTSGVSNYKFSFIRWIYSINFIKWKLRRLVFCANAAMRIKYKDKSETFTEDQLITKEPFGQFKEWFDVASKTPGIQEPNAMCLGTATK